MNIYIAHAKKSEFQKELYEPIRSSSLNNEHTFVLPHEISDQSFDSKAYFKNEANLSIAEVSNSATGLGIELGWANAYELPIICVYKKDSKLSGSLKRISKYFVEYSDSNELIFGIEKILKQIEDKD